MTSERAETLRSFDGTPLFFRCFTPKNKGKLKGLVLVVHGFAEHSGRYAEFARWVCGKNMACAGFDLRGHGHSGPGRGDAESLEALILDVIFVINHVQEIIGLQGQDDGFFGVVGHSFGGLLLTYAASLLGTHCPPVFLSSPCYRVKQTVPLWKKVVARGLPYVLPRMPVPLEVQPSFLSENDANNKAYVADEGNLSHVTARLGQIFLGAMDDQRLRQNIPLVRVPCTIVNGAGDKLTDQDFVKSLLPLFQRAQLQTVEGAGHEIFNENQVPRDAARAALLRWIDLGGQIN